MSLEKEKDKPDGFLETALSADELIKLRALDSGNDLLYKGRRYFVFALQRVGGDSRKKSITYTLVDAETCRDLGYIELDEDNSVKLYPHSQFADFTEFLNGYEVKEYEVKEGDTNQSQLTKDDIEYLKTKLKVYPRVFFNKKAYISDFFPYPDGSFLFRVHDWQTVALAVRFNPKTEKLLSPPYPNINVLKDYIKNADPYEPRAAQQSKNGANGVK